MDKPQIGEICCIHIRGWLLGRQVSSHTDTHRPQISGHRHTHSDLHTGQTTCIQNLKKCYSVRNCHTTDYITVYRSVSRMSSVSELFCADSKPHGCAAILTHAGHQHHAVQTRTVPYSPLFLHIGRQAPRVSGNPLECRRGKEKREASWRSIKMQFSQSNSDVQRTWWLRTMMENLAESRIFKFPKETLQENCSIGEKMNKKKKTLLTTATTNKLITNKIHGISSVFQTLQNYDASRSYKERWRGS